MKKIAFLSIALFAVLAISSIVFAQEVEDDVIDLSGTPQPEVRVPQVLAPTPATPASTYGPSIPTGRTPIIVLPQIAEPHRSYVKGLAGLAINGTKNPLWTLPSEVECQWVKTLETLKAMGQCDLDPTSVRIFDECQAPRLALKIDSVEVGESANALAWDDPRWSGWWKSNRNMFDNLSGRYSEQNVVVRMTATLQSIRTKGMLFNSEGVQYVFNGVGEAKNKTIDTTIFGKTSAKDPDTTLTLAYKKAMVSLIADMKKQLKDCSLQ